MTVKSILIAIGVVAVLFTLAFLALSIQDAVVTHEWHVTDSESAYLEMKNIGMLIQLLFSVGAFLMLILGGLLAWVARHKIKEIINA